MKFVIILNALILFIICFIQSHQEQPTSLFRIVQYDRTGYMNEKGDIIIQPTYQVGNDFSDGLAAVRKNGWYGFIDMHGKFVIKPAYDFATDFKNGVALVYKEGKPLFIDKQGTVVLPPAYTSLWFINDKKGIVTTTTRKKGVIDISTKKLVIDTAYSVISTFKNGVAIIQDSTQVAVIDINGNIIVPFGTYTRIYPFSDGVAVVNMKEERSYGVIDTMGKLVFKGHGSTGDEFHEGLAKIYLSNNVNYSRGYEGYINQQGEIVLNDPNYDFVHPFSNGRAFVRKFFGDYILLDRNFKRVGNESYSFIDQFQFQDNYAVVKTSDGYGVIDTMGNYVLKPRYAGIRRINGNSDVFFFLSTNNTGLYGMVDLKGNVMTKAIIKEFDKNGYRNGLLRVIINDGIAYLNKKGEVVWAPKEENPATLKVFDIDYMNRGYFYAYSSPDKIYTSASGGWGKSSNIPKSISTEQFPKHLLAVTINTTKLDTFQNQYLGYKLYISNTTVDTVRFNVEDSRLNMILQAQDKNGTWRDIEYAPTSWCGNSYHEIELLPGNYWQFTIPRYHGGIKTNIRAKLQYIDKFNPEEEKTVYSNTIVGSINPGQFWNEMEYYSQGIMDPYFN